MRTKNVAKSACVVFKLSDNQPTRWPTRTTWTYTATFVSRSLSSRVKNSARLCAQSAYFAACADEAPPSFLADGDDIYGDGDTSAQQPATGSSAVPAAAAPAPAVPTDPRLNRAAASSSANANAASPSTGTPQPGSSFVGALPTSMTGAGAGMPAFGGAGAGAGDAMGAMSFGQMPNMAAFGGAGGMNMDAMKQMMQGSLPQQQQQQSQEQLQQQRAEEERRNTKPSDMPDEGYVSCLSTPSLFLDSLRSLLASLLPRAARPARQSALRVASRSFDPQEYHPVSLDSVYLLSLSPLFVATCLCHALVCAPSSVLPTYRKMFIGGLNWDTTDG